MAYFVDEIEVICGRPHIDMCDTANFFCTCRFFAQKPGYVEVKKPIVMHPNTTLLHIPLLEFSGIGNIFGAKLNYLAESILHAIEIGESLY